MALGAPKFIGLFSFSIFMESGWKGHPDRLRKTLTWVE